MHHHRGQFTAQFVVILSVVVIPQIEFISAYVQHIVALISQMQIYSVSEKKLAIIIGLLTVNGLTGP